MNTKNKPKQTQTGPWLTYEAIKTIRRTPELRRAIEDYYGITGYSTINVWCTNRSNRLMHENVLKIIAAYMRKEVSEITTPSA